MCVRVCVLKILLISVVLLVINVVKVLFIFSSLGFIVSPQPTIDIIQLSKYWQSNCLKLYFTVVVFLIF